MCYDLVSERYQSALRLFWGVGVGGVGLGGGGAEFNRAKDFKLDVNKH